MVLSFSRVYWSAVPAPVPYANLTNPQTLNLYAMVADDPESFADLDGHDPGCNAGGYHSNPGNPLACQGQVDNDEQNHAACTNATCGDQAPQQKAQNQNQQNQDEDKKKDATAADGGQSGKGGGGGRKGERKRTRRPENPDKHVQPVPGKPGRWRVKDPHTGKWKEKPPGWQPYPLTNFEIAQNEASARYSVKAWTAITIGLAATLTVVTGFGAFGGGAAAGEAAGEGATTGVGAGATPVPVPLTP